MHRFVWDLHFSPPDSLEHEYPISAIYRDTPRYPLGQTALPGKYTVKLTVAGKTLSQSLVIKMDPRVKTPAEGLEQQFNLETKIVAAMHRDYLALQEVRSLRDQLRKLTGAKRTDVTNSIAAVESKLGVLEGSTGSTFLVGAEGRSLARLNRGLNQLLSTVDSADTAPTQQASLMCDQLLRVLEEQLATWNEIKESEVPALNRRLKAANLSPVRISER